MFFVAVLAEAALGQRNKNGLSPWVKRRVIKAFQAAFAEIPYSRRESPTNYSKENNNGKGKNRYIDKKDVQVFSRFSRHNYPPSI